MGAQTPQLMSILPMLLIFVVFYFLLIRPQKKQQKEHEAMLSNLQKNDNIVTSGGIHGVIVNLKEKTVVIRVDENVRIEIDKKAVTYKSK